MKRNPRAMRAKSILTSELRKLILTVGIITSIVGIVVYLLLVYATDYSDASIRTIMFIVFSLDSILFALSLKNLHGPFWKVDFLGNRYLLFAIGMSIMLLIVTLTLSPLRALLSLEPLTPSAFLILSGVGIANLLTIELSKKFVFRAKNG